MPKGEHRPVSVRLERAISKRSLCTARLNSLEIKQAQIAIKEGKCRNQIARWDKKITRLEAQLATEKALTQTP